MLETRRRVVKTLGKRFSVRRRCGGTLQRLRAFVCARARVM